MPEDKKDIQQNQSVHYDPILFHNDEQLYFVYKKVEAISGAVFLITHGISETEVIKHTLREQSLNMMNRMVSLIGQQKVDVSDLHVLSSSVTYIHSLLDIAFWSGVVSQMNISLIQREIGLVYKVVNDLIAKYKENFYLDSSFFENTSLPLQTKQSDQMPPQSQPHVEPPVIEKNENTPSVAAVEYKGQFKQQVKGQSIKDKVNNPAQPAENSDRKEAILSLLRERGTMGIKDVAAVIPSVSEKTIQRELLSLVSDGLIKKEGERRWSMYSIA